jgi:hypothetical protein
MNTKIKKIFVGILTLIMMMAGVGCSNKGVCDECGQEAKLTKYVLQGGMGNAGDAGNIEYLCDDCIRIAKAFGY